MFKPFTKAILNNAADGTVHLFKNCVGLTDRAVCSSSFLRIVSDLGTSGAGVQESGRNFGTNSGCHDGKLILEFEGLHPTSGRVCGYGARHDRLRPCDRQFGDISGRLPRDWYAYAAAIARPLHAFAQSLGDRPMATSALTASRATSSGIAQGLSQSLVIGIRRLARLAEIFVVSGIALLGMIGLRDLHLNGGDLLIRSGRVKRLSQYPLSG